MTSQLVDPYQGAKAPQYDAHHAKNMRTRYTTRREQLLLSRALKHCGEIKSALDLPCGTGRFWPVFEQAGVDRLHAGDMSEAMLGVARLNPPNVAEFSCEVMDAFDIDLPDNHVEFISSQRFFHHLSRASDRMLALGEIHRVTSSYAAISLWVDGNYQSRRYINKAIDPEAEGFGRRICRRREDVEREFQEAGFDVINSQDVWPYVAMWRLYLLRVR